MGGSHETPFKMKGSGHYGLGNSSPAKNAPGPPDHKHPHPKPPSKRELKAYKMPHMLDVSLGETHLSDARKAEINQFLENQ